MNTTTSLMERRFFIGFGFLVALVVFAGFSRSYYLRPFTGAPPISAPLFLHGLLFTSWIVLFVVQAALVTTGHAEVHRRLGMAGGCLLVVLLVSGWATAIAAARLGHIPAAKAGVTDPLAALAIPLRDLLVFAALAATALYFRRHSDIHKRLMVLATINLMPAALGRIPMPDPLVGVGMLAFLLAGPVYDRFTRGRVHWIYWSGGCITIVSIFVQFTLGRTEIWHHFASWLIR